ncbi:hypothetical protein CP556_22670 [Natrinema sp. CBA1119]|nr:hypothetical protein CP556_22670 [Natrinema sp. CBA1119]
MAQTLFEHEPVASTDGKGHWIVVYEGTTYVAMLDLVQYGSLRRDMPTSSNRRSPRRVRHEPRSNRWPSRAVKK